MILEKTNIFLLHEKKFNLSKNLNVAEISGMSRYIFL